MRQELRLTYLQIGLLLGVPSLLCGLFEPILCLLADARRRRVMVITGGVLFGISLAITAASQGFWLLLFSFVLFYPASGAFVTLSQAELMDREPAHRDKNMAMWTFAGSAGSAVGPLALVAASRLGFGWRGLYLSIGTTTMGVLLLAIRHAYPRTPAAATKADPEEDPPLRFRDGVRGALRALKTSEVIRWLVLLELANLMLDVFFGYLALYFVDVTSVSVEQAAIGVVVWTVSEIVGDLLLIPLLDRVHGLVYLRISAGMVAVAFPCFLLVGPFAWKLALIALIGFLRAGWYAILQARFYAALPGQSGIAVALGNLAGSAGGLIPLCLGAVAEAAGLRAAMWLLMVAPLALLIGLPRKKR